MREALDQWAFVYGAYAVGVGAIVLVVAWAWFSMRAAEKRREESRKK